MNVRTLIDMLSELDPNLRVKVSGDPEGNGFYSLSGIQEMYVDSPVDRWFHEEAHDAEDIAEYEEDEDDSYIPHYYEKVLILWP